jgi:hypothetical protein
MVSSPQVVTSVSSSPHLSKGIASVMAILRRRITLITVVQSFTNIYCADTILEVSFSANSSNEKGRQRVGDSRVDEMARSGGGKQRVILQFFFALLKTSVR